MGTHLATVGVLLVEDFEPFRRFVSSTIQNQQNLRIIGEVSDGMDAIEKAEQLQPDLILLDIGLPKLDGIETAKRIRQLSPQSRIIFLTENADEDVMASALDTGAVAYVLKSEMVRRLVPAIRDAVWAEL
jgi:DNA-binding NarL/FixJ family response regulator